MLKTIFFDLGNVLLFFSFPKMFGQLSSCTGLPSTLLEELFFGTELRQQYEKGLLSTEELYQRFLQKANRPFTLAEFTLALSDIFTPNQELWPLVEKLKKGGLRLILLSNTCECHFTYAASRYPILRHFDHKILSYEVGAWKPDAKIFESALSRAECAPHECFYTDDVPAFIAGAKKVGLPGEVFTDVPRLEAELIQRGCTFLEEPQK